MKKRISLTEATEFTERGESRADMACKFLRERKIYRPYFFSALSVSSPLKAGQASEFITPEAWSNERVREIRECEINS